MSSLLEPADGAGPVIPLADFKAYIPVERSTNDRLVQGILDGAVGFVGATYTRRALLPLAATEVRRRVNGSRFIRVPDARTVTSVVIDGVAQSDFERLDSPGASHTTTMIEVFASGQVALVVGEFGMGTVPPDLVEAIMALASRRYWQRAAGLSDSVQSDEYGTATYFRAMPAEVRMVLDSYRVASDHMGLA